MEVKYSRPVLNEDGTVLVEQVYVMGSGAMENGIKKRELKVIQELYPNMELLRETISRAKSNYEDVEMQGNKTVAQLEGEKSALIQLENWVSEMK